MTAIIGTYEGADPWTGNSTYAKMMGQEAAGTLLFTGQASWTDYVGSAAWAASTTASIGAQKLWSIPLFANSSSLKEAASGADNSYFVQVAKSLLSSQASGSIYVRTGWEFNGGWETWSAGTDTADYIKAYQQFVTAFRSVSNRFVFTWAPGESNGGMNPALAYPGDAYVDIIGLDVYDNNAFDGNNATAAFNAKLNDTYGLNWLANFAAQHGKQIAIPEWGVNNDNDAAFVTLMANWIKTHNVAYASYWDANAGGFNGLLSSMPTVEAAYVAAFGTSATSSTTPTPAPTSVVSPSSSVHKVASDLDGDHKSDILLFNASTSAVSAIQSGSGLSSSAATTLGTASSGWSVAGVSDFDGDGKADILWISANAHDVQLWESSNGMGPSHSVDLGAVGGDWWVKGVGDFDGDGKADVLWENSVTHDVQLWESTRGLGPTKSVDLGAVAQGWAIAGVGDFDGDGKSDVLWVNSSSHLVQLWDSSTGEGPTKAITVGSAANNLTVAGVGDFDGDGKADILWFNTATRDVQLWESTAGLGPTKSLDLGSVSSGWTIVQVGDFDGDGKADVLWYNTQSHDLQVWESSHGLGSSHSIDLGVLSPSLSIATNHF